MAGDSVINVYVSPEGAEGGRLRTSQEDAGLPTPMDARGEGEGVSDAGLPTPMDARGEGEGVSDAGLPTPTDSQGEGNSVGSEPSRPKAPKGGKKDGTD